MDRVIFRIVKVENQTNGKPEYRYEPIRLSELLKSVRAEIADRSASPKSLCSAN